MAFRFIAGSRRTGSSGVSEAGGGEVRSSRTDSSEVGSTPIANVGLSQVRSSLLAWLLPLECARSRELVESPGATGALCRACARERTTAPLLPVPDGMAWCGAPFAYEGVVKHEVLSMKATGRIGSIPFMAKSMYQALVPILHPDMLIVWAPTSKRRVRSRGFDQAEELARGLSRHTGLVVARVALSGSASLHSTVRHEKEGPELRFGPGRSLRPVTGPM